MDLLVVMKYLAMTSFFLFVVILVQCSRGSNAGSLGKDRTGCVRNLTGCVRNLTECVISEAQEALKPDAFGQVPDRKSGNS